MRIIQEPALDFEDVLIEPKRSSINSRKDVKLERTFTFVHSRREWTGLPIMVANMSCVGTFEMFQYTWAQRAIVALHKHYTADEYVNFFSKLDDDQINYVFYSIGMRDEDVEKLQYVFETVCGRIVNINIDVPNGHIEGFIEFVNKVRRLFPNQTISAGNVANPSVAEALIQAGADIVKAGIGPGAMCTTRLKTGVGVPQLTCIMECADAVHGLNGHLIGDGGLKHAGDFAKGFGAGADFLMAGSFFSGYLGNSIVINGKEYLEMYGMSSTKANDKYAGGLKKYRAAEGREALIPRKSGSLMNVFQDICGGLRSAATYIGARELKHFGKCMTFRIVRRQINASMEKHEK